MLPISEAPAAIPAAVAPADGLADAAPIWAAPIEPAAVFPPPAWTPPIESEAVLVPPPPTVSGALTLAEVLPRLADADGDELTGLDCATPTACDDVLPPPTWTEPTEFEAVLLPVPATEVGADTPAVAPAWLAPAVGFTAVLPT